MTADTPTSHLPQNGLGRVPETPYLGQEERVLLEQGKVEHRQTTAAARRALQVAEKTHDVARNTLVEIHRQGEQLERAEMGLEEVGREVKEASALLRFMRRCCCLQCWDCCDPTVEQDRTRKQRVAAARQGMQQQQQSVQQHYASKQQGVDRRARQHDPAYGNGQEVAARQELLARAGAVREAWQGPAPTDIGFGLPEEDRSELRQETDQQDELLHRIGYAVESLHEMSKEMHSELREQQPRVDRLTGATVVAHDQLGSLAREARRV